MNPTRSSVLFSRSSRSSRLSRLSPSALLALAAAAGCTADAATYREPSVAPRHAPRRELAPLVALADPTVAPDRGAGAVDAGDLPTTAAPDRSAAAIALLRQRGPAGLAAVLAEYGDVRGEETVAATSADAARPGDRQARAVRPPAPPAAPLADVAGYRRPAYYPYLERPFGRMARHRRAVIGQRAAEKLELPAVLDDRSRQLIAALVAAEPSDASRASGASGQTEPSAPVESRKIEPLLARFEQRMLADTALNQVRLRPSILRHLRESPGLSMDALNAWVYEHVFATPRSDAWLGLRTSDEYSGLPGDGVVIGRQVARREPAATPSVSAARNGYTRRR